MDLLRNQLDLRGWTVVPQLSLMKTPLYLMD
jgi:hypothetical protein